MKLKFIGADYSMGLRNGKIYNVHIKSSSCHIIIFVEKNLFHGIECPYDTPQAFAKNWSGC